MRTAPATTPMIIYPFSVESNTYTVKPYYQVCTDEQTGAYFIVKIVESDKGVRVGPEYARVRERVTDAFCGICPNDNSIAWYTVGTSLIRFRLYLQAGAGVTVKEECQFSSFTAEGCLWQRHRDAREKCSADLSRFPAVDFQRETGFDTHFKAICEAESRKSESTKPEIAQLKPEIADLKWRDRYNFEALKTAVVAVIKREVMRKTTLSLPSEGQYKQILEGLKLDWDVLVEEAENEVALQVGIIAIAQGEVTEDLPECSLTFCANARALRAWFLPENIYLYSLRLNTFKDTASVTREGIYYFLGQVFLQVVRAQKVVVDDSRFPKTFSELTSHVKMNGEEPPSFAPTALVGDYAQFFEFLRFKLEGITPSPAVGVLEEGLARHEIHFYRFMLGFEEQNYNAEDQQVSDHLLIYWVNRRGGTPESVREWLVQKMQRLVFEYIHAQVSCLENIEEVSEALWEGIVWALEPTNVTAFIQFVRSWSVDNFVFAWFPIEMEEPHPIAWLPMEMQWSPTEQDHLVCALRCKRLIEEVSAYEAGEVVSRDALAACMPQERFSDGYIFKSVLRASPKVLFEKFIRHLPWTDKWLGYTRFFPIVVSALPDIDFRVVIKNRIKNEEPPPMTVTLEESRLQKLLMTIGGSPLKKTLEIYGYLTQQKRKILLQEAAPFLTEEENLQLAELEQLVQKKVPSADRSLRDTFCFSAAECYRESILTLFQTFGDESSSKLVFQRLLYKIFSPTLLRMHKLKLEPLVQLVRCLISFMDEREKTSLLQQVRNALMPDYSGATPLEIRNTDDFLLLYRNLNWPENDILNVALDDRLKRLLQEDTDSRTLPRILKQIENDPSVFRESVLRSLAISFCKLSDSSFEEHIRSVHFSDTDKHLLFKHMLSLKMDNIQEKIQAVCVIWFCEPGQLRQFYDSATPEQQLLLDSNLLGYVRYLCEDLQATPEVDKFARERQEDWCWILQHPQIATLIGAMEVLSRRSKALLAWLPLSENAACKVVPFFEVQVQTFAIAKNFLEDQTSREPTPDIEPLYTQSVLKLGLRKMEISTHKI